MARPAPQLLPARAAAPDQAEQEAQLAFLARVAHHGIIGRAMVESQVHPRELRAWRAQPEFAEALQAAQDLAADFLEGVAWDRAVVGTKVPVYGAHGKVGEKVERDHQLLVLLLKARKPGHFRDRPTAAPLPDAAARRAEYEAQMVRLRLKRPQEGERAQGEQAQTQAQEHAPGSQPPRASAPSAPPASYDERGGGGQGGAAPPAAGGPSSPSSPSSPSPSHD